MPEVKGKKLPKWALPVGIAGVVIAILIYKHKQSASSSSATELGSEGLSNQSFIPVTGENVAGMGAGGYGGGAPSGESINPLLLELLKGKETSDIETKKIEREFFERTISNLTTGGGAPTSSAPPGSTTAPPQGGGTSPAPPPASPAPPKPTAKCPGDYPLWNPANGSPSPHSCWRYSRDRCPNKAMPYKHAYQDGHFVCAAT